MPELPEVETIRSGILSRLGPDRTLIRIHVRNGNLRWPVDIRHPPNDERLLGIRRRGKYLLFELQSGTAIVHLGMSGSLRSVHSDDTPLLHDHYDFVFDGDQTIRYNDPRRFGSLHWWPKSEGDIASHPRLTNLGPEPLDRKFGARYLFERSRSLKTPVKPFLMDQRVVVGVGNIYANESLFRARIRPDRQARSVTMEEYQRLIRAVKRTLRDAIQACGTTLLDGGYRTFTQSNGEYFDKLVCYGRGGLPCSKCGHLMSDDMRIRDLQTVYCPICQT